MTPTLSHGVTQPLLVLQLGVLLVMLCSAPVNGDFRRLRHHQQQQLSLQQLVEQSSYVNLDHLDSVALALCSQPTLSQQQQNRHHQQRPFQTSASVHNAILTFRTPLDQEQLFQVLMKPHTFVSGQCNDNDNNHNREVWPFYGKIASVEKIADATEPAVAIQLDWASPQQVRAKYVVKVSLRCQYAM